MGILVARIGAGPLSAIAGCAPSGDPVVTGGKNLYPRLETVAM
jgi:hypothetical protein